MVNRPHTPLCLFCCFVAACASESENRELASPGSAVEDGEESPYILEPEQVLNEDYAAASSAVGYLLWNVDDMCPGNGADYCEIPFTTYNTKYWAEGGLCDSQRLGDQPTILANLATAFLVYDGEPGGSRTMVTARHIFEHTSCEGTAVVFDVRTDYLPAPTSIRDGLGTIRVPATNVFECEKVLSDGKEYQSYYVEDGDWYIDDFVVFTIRPIAGGRGLTTGRSGLCMSRNPAARAPGVPTYAVGHMLGLPQKYHFGGWVQTNWSMLGITWSSLLGYPGLSGGPVINALNHRVIGVAAMGTTNGRSPFQFANEDRECLLLADPLWGPYTASIDADSAIDEVLGYYRRVDEEQGVEPRDLTWCHD